MSVSEFDIIDSYFNISGLASEQSGQAGNIALGIGDDCALISVAEGHQLAVSMDVLVADVHFPSTAKPELIARKALAVNLSDLAAMGAVPVGFTLGLTLPNANPQWLTAFSDGLRIAAQKYSCPLIGGDMSKGPMAISIQVHGTVKIDKAMCRTGARPGNLVFVTGLLGEAGLGLDLVQGRLAHRTLSVRETQVLESAYYLPEPRIEFAQALSGLASSAIDVSDGLLADLGHIARSSGVLIKVSADKLPVSPLVQKIISHESALEKALSAGDDYELIFTLAADNVSALESISEKTGLNCTCIGEVQEGSGVICLDKTGNQIETESAGYNHFL